jgi:peptide-methionine (S)-S-oxide reductase
VGYAGGDAANPTYRRIGDHTEVFQVDFDPSAVGFEELLELALASHDPTRVAHKAQYASLVLAHDEAQLAIARSVAARFEERLGRKLATRIEPLKRFYNAEDYHQKYYLRSDRTLMADFKAMFGADEDAFRESTAAARANGYVAGGGSRALLAREIDLLGLTGAGSARLAGKGGESRLVGGCSIG